ncbi:MAG: 3-hydroxyacyl-CoA dehydrogenase [Alphaproteobacteria bacterium]|nr:3-hydroxyacyl-CoA dehydrogenase [Alphaproteobacteria bacterium]
MSDLVSLSKHGAVGVVTVDNPPVNALSNAVRSGIRDTVAKAVADPAIKAIVVLGAGRTFIAGADIREFAMPRDPNSPDLNQVNDLLENSPKPTVAAIHGTALGGGMEIVLSCHYRCAVKGSQVGLPEVKLGLLPGAGGTQRLPRAIGVKAALPLIVSGDMVPADKAQALGAVDHVFEGDLLKGALAYAERLIAEGAKPRRLSERADKLGEVAANDAALEEFRQANAKLFKNTLAPRNILATVRNSYALPFAEGLKKERELFEELRRSPQSRGMIHAFFGEREVAKVPDVGKEVRPRKIASAAVIGFGTMGGGIAMNFANVGIPVKVLELNAEALERGRKTVEKNYAFSVQRGRLAQAEMDKRMALLQPVSRYEDLAEADIVIEAVFEEMDIKKEVFAKLDKVAKPGAVLASNTSTLDIDAIANATARPAEVIGMHFFSPANVMRLLEIVRGKATAKDVIATAMDVAKAIRKVGVVVGNCDGFVGNRMLARYSREAYRLVEEGCLPWQVDQALQDWGLAMGPFAMADLAGLDVGYRIRKRRAAEGRGNQSESGLLEKLIEKGRHGQKTGAGYYRYDKGDRAGKPDPEVAAMIESYSAALGVKRRTDIGADEIVERCIYPLVNEGAKILEEGIALRAVDIDIIYLTGYGFPAYRGGPMKYAEEVGLPKVLAALDRYFDKFGEHWKPAELIRRLAREGKGFAKA